MQRLILALGALTLAAGCVTARATSFELPQRRVNECVQLCNSVGLRMSALVVVMDAAGCVCETPLGGLTPGMAPSASAAAVSGTFVVAKQMTRVSP